MPDEAEMDLDGHSVEEQLKAFQISSLKDEDLDEEEGEAADSNSDVVDDDDCEAEPVTLGKSSLCDICQTPLQFLLQVYAPISEKESTFHRSLFVFMCTSMECILQDKREQWKCPPEKASRSVKVFRCQLPRSNPFYSSEPPRGDGTDKPSGIGVAFCSNFIVQVCSSCRKAHYCSEKHQVMHWRSGHKFVCRQMKTSSESSNSIPVNNRTTSNKLEKVASNTMWSEYEIINEDECEFDIEMSEDNGYSSSLVSNDRSDETFKALLKHFEADDDKKSWTSFQECIGKAPEQVLR
ncbi:Programmed cell death protein 2 [Vitis vinifera]|uniref:Programmed cell death protein 2 n=1 Tax=Vitis vinifera TaxID=29760 RepID=A0A438FJ09_VITVI|nr:Programmed cell death protein 2 [Vitis vinifera]